MEIELLDAEGRPRAPVAGAAAHRRPSHRPLAPSAVAAAVGLAVACGVLVVGGLVGGMVRARAAGDLDRRVTSASAAQAAAVVRSGSLDAPEPAMALQVLQSPGVVVESTGPPADRAMVVQVPRPATTELSTYSDADGSRGRRYRVAATTLPSPPGVAGRTVVAAALPLGSVGAADRPVRATATAVAVIAGVSAAGATRRRLRRRQLTPPT